MQITTILLVSAAILTLLSGIAVFAGITKRERDQGAWFFIMTIGTAIWSVAIAVFLALPENATSIAPAVLFALYVGAMVMLAAFVGYVGWKFKIGKILSIIYSFLGIILTIILALSPNVLYSEIILSHTGNSIHIVDGWFYWVYIAYCVLTAISMLGFTLYRMLHAKKPNERAGMTVLMVGTSIAGIVLSIFDLFLPMQRYDLIWIGPLATSLNILCFYYAILRFHVMTLTTSWLKALSYIIIMMTGAVIYTVAFFAIFTAIFRIPSPSTSILLLNFTMVIIVLFLIPVIIEISSFVKSFIEVQAIDIAYVTKKLNHIRPQDVNLQELASFLADHIHFEFVGLLVDGKLYGSTSSPLSVDELTAIEALKPTKPGSIWLNDVTKKPSSSQNLKLIAELRDDDGKPIGQIIFDQPLGNIKFDRRDLIQLEMIINLVGATITK